MELFLTTRALFQVNRVCYEKILLGFAENFVVSIILYIAAYDCEKSINTLFYPETYQFCLKVCLCRIQVQNKESTIEIDGPSDWRFEMKVVQLLGNTWPGTLYYLQLDGLSNY